MTTFGDYMRETRSARGLTLRQFCEEASLDPAFVSRVERGRRRPPADPAILKQWARHLGIKINSAEWATFADLASVAAGRVPSDILADEDLAAKLPLLFRTLRSNQLNEDVLRGVVDIVKKG